MEASLEPLQLASTILSVRDKAVGSEIVYTSSREQLFISVIVTE